MCYMGGVGGVGGGVGGVGGGGGGIMNFFVVVVVVVVEIFYHKKWPEWPSFSSRANHHVVVLDRASFLIPRAIYVRRWQRLQAARAGSNCARRCSRAMDICE